MPRGATRALGRRAMLLACGIGLVGPRTLRARSAPADHRLEIETPLIAENPAAVPVQVSVD